MIPDSNCGFYITLIKQKSSRIFEQLLVQAGIGEFNGAQGRILHVLWQEDEVPIVLLGKRTGLAVSTLTSMLDRMEGLGLLCRRPDSRDRRKLLICLTEKARGLKEQYDAVSLRISEIYFRGFQDAEILQLESYLQRVSSNLDAFQEAAGAEREESAAKQVSPAEQRAGEVSQRKDMRT